MVSDITTLIIFSFLIFTEIKYGKLVSPGCQRGALSSILLSVYKQANKFQKNTVYRVIFALLYLDSPRESCVEREITEDLEFAIWQRERNRRKWKKSEYFPVYIILKNQNAITILMQIL